ncbi:MAG: tripartite tricarboxylate transporter substrate binding protein [Betaproteobacteria bacterium]|nr:tripartite tricarboxylate transporter substrate binding protein [Betaproteobacteria bacterium]
MNAIATVVRTLIVLASAGLCLSSNAQPYPTKPIRFVVPFAPGGATDILARMVARRLTDTLGQQVIVDNRGGAAGRIGTEIVARAIPDGYTIAIGHVGTLAMNPTLFTNLSYDPLKDLTPISLIAMMPNALVVSKSLPVTSVKDLIAMARAKPNTILYGSGGNGSSNHLGIVYLELLAKIKLTHVSYKGGGPAIVDLIAGNISVMMPGLLPVAPHIKSGRIRLIAVSTRARLPIFPEVPTIAESGVSGYEYSNWMGVVGPAKIPPAIVRKLNEHLAEATAHPEFKTRLAVEGGDATNSSSAQFRTHIKEEIARWAPVVKASGPRRN